MATPVIPWPTALDSLPLVALGDEKPVRDVRLGRAKKSSKALRREATADQHDTSDSDDQPLESEKKLEVQADTSDSDDQGLEGEKEAEVQSDTTDKPRSRPLPLPLPRPQAQAKAQTPTQTQTPPRLQSAAADGTSKAPGPEPAAFAEQGTVGTKANETDAKKQQKVASAVVSSKSDAKSETAAADGGVHKSRLPFRRQKKDPRKGGKREKKGGLGRAWEKVSLILGPQTYLTGQPTLLAFSNPSIRSPTRPL
jgi:hypothetical protein